FAVGKLKRVEIAGGAPRTLCDTGNVVGGTWGPNGQIVVGIGTGQNGSGLFRVPATGGKPELLVKPDQSRGETGLLWPEFLPDGRHVTYLAWHADAGQRWLYTITLEGGTPVRLVNATSQALYLPPGQLLFHREGTLFSQPFDAAGVRLSGEPRPV